MLAWLHQATASEKEHLEALLKNVNQCGTHIYSQMSTARCLYVTAQRRSVGAQNEQRVPETGYRTDSLAAC